MFEFIRKCLTVKPDAVTNQRTSEQASMPTLGGGEAVASGAPDTPGGTEMAGDSSSWLIAGRSQMAERSPQKLDVRAPLLVYAARLKPSQEPLGCKFGPIWQYWHSGRNNAPDIC